MWILIALLAGLAAPEAPLAVPEPPPAEDLPALVAAARAAEPEADVVVVLDDTEVKVEATGLSRTERRRVLVVNTEAGASALSSLRFDYDPASNEVKVAKAEIVGLDGARRPVPLDALLDLPQPQHMIYWGARMKLLPIPRLAPGEALEVVTQKKGFVIAYLDGETGATGRWGGPSVPAAPPDASEERPAEPPDASEEPLQSEEPAASDERYIPPMRGHFYDVVLFGDSPWPTRAQRYRVTLPRALPLQFKTYNATIESRSRFDDATHTFEFSLRGLPAHEAGPQAADAVDYLPKVVMATVPDWQAKSRWFFAINEGQYEADEAIWAALPQILKGAKTDEARIAAILRWTALNIRYSGISMGKGEGYTLHTGAQTFHDRAGVCKDMAGMAITLLRAAGLPANPAMTYAGGRVEEIPADQFNHCVVAVKRPEGYRMIDPTWAPFSSELWSAAEREQHYVVGSAEGETLLRTPYLPPEHNRLTIEAESQIEADGTLKSEVTLTGSGYLEDRLRRLIAYTPASELKAKVSHYLARVSPQVVLDRLEWSDHRDLAKPMRLVLRYRVAHYAQVGAGVVRLPAIPVARHLLGEGGFVPWREAASPKTRRSAIWLSSPQRLEFRERLRVPKGLTLAASAPVRFENELGGVSASLTLTGDALRYEQVARLAQRNLPPESLPALKAWVEAVDGLGLRAVTLEASP